MISSTSNPKIKNLKKLMNSAKLRRQKQCFPVEGPRMFFEIPKDRILECYVTEEFEHKYGDEIKHYRYEVVEEHVMHSLSDTRSPQGVLAVVSKDETKPEDLLKAERPYLFVIIENLQDPGNLGTLLRTAEGAGAGGVIIDRQSVDPYNMKVIRSTMGAIFRLPIVIVDDPAEACRRLKDSGITIYAGHLDGEPFYQGDYRGDCAFMIGNEGNGLSSAILKEADKMVRIPMKGRAESLNASVAGAVMIYEALRQREQADKQY